MSGPYDNHYAFNTGYGQPQGYYDYNQQHAVAAYPTQGFAGQQQSYDAHAYQQQPQSYYNAQDSYYQPQTQPQYGQQPAEGERGILGAMAGGAAGAAGGHKMGHGILGAIGGAILGSLTEDYAKSKNRKHKNKHGHHNQHQSRRDGSHHSHSHSNSNSSMSGGLGGLGPMASSFFNNNQKR